MKLLKDILKGAVIGISNIIPGVSGGTMAVSMGIYDTIISAITHLFKDFKQSVKTLLPYFIGMGLGIVGLSFLIEYLFKHLPLQTSCLFIGLILGGLPIITSKIKGKKLSACHIILFLIFFILIIGMQLIKGERITELKMSFDVLQMIKLLGIGVIASATMVIPGVSGSLLLMILGYYTPIIESINAFIKALTSGNTDVLISNFLILFPFGIGVLVGIFVIAKIIDFLLSKFEIHTYSAILGLIFASPFAIILSQESLTLNVSTILTSILTFVVGVIISILLSKNPE